MDSYPHILRLPGISAATTSFQSDTRQTPSVPDDYVLSEAFVCPLATASAPGDPTAAVSKLNGIAAKYAHFQRSIAPCVLASCNDLASHPKAAASSRTADLSRSPSENAKSAKNAERPKSSGASKPPTAAAATVSIPTSCAPPDLASFWLATSPLPPTAVLTALYSLLPLRRVSVVDSDAHDNSIVSETRAGGEDSEVMRDRKPSTSLETLWTLCRSAESVEKDQRQVSFWEAFCMTAMTVHSVAGTATYGGSAVPSQESSSSASSFSLSQQLRRATAVLGSLQQTSASATAATAPVLSPGTSVLTWPEEFLWNLLMSLLSVVALVHGAGLHFFGQLTASNVLCFACASSLPRLLEQTWQDVVAANGIPKHVASRPDSVALFRRFYSIAGQGVLLPQASLTSETPCHNAFFVVRPSLELMRRRLPQNGADGVKAAKSGKESEDADASVAVTSAAQEAADETPAQQACFQAADLASVGRLLTTVMELRARWSSEGGQSFSSAVAAAPPSSELVFLVRRLCECELTAGSAAAAATTKSSNLPRSGPTALQLLQLQALRLRTETWYYRRAAAEAYDRLAQLQLAQPPLHPVESSVMPAQRAVTEPQTQARTTKEGEGEEKLQAREAAVAEREAKLDLILRVYELTHEHLDAVNLPKSQTPSTDQTESSYRLDERGDKTPARSQTPRDDSLEPSLPARTYLPTTKTAAHAAALRSESRPTPISNISHPPQREAFTHATADTSGEMLLGLSPLVRMSNAEDADVTLLSTSATPFASLYGADERSARSATHPPPWSVPTTHRELQVGEPPAYTAVVAEQQSTEEEGASVTTTWATEEARRTPQTAVAAPQGAVADSNNAPRVVARLSPSLPAGEPMYTPWNGSQAQTQQPTQQQQQHQSFHPWEPQRHRDPNSSASAPAPVTVVEVELDDSSDSEDASRTQPNAFSSDAARRWRTQHVAPDEQQVVRATPHGAQLVVSPDPQPPPPPLPPSFFSPTFASPTSRFAPDVQTPVRAPSLPNMGIADADVSGGGRSRSKYSPLAQLRSPPSARRPASASRNADSSLSLSPNSPESYRSSTMPSATVAPAYTPITTYTTTTMPTTDAPHASQQEPPPPPQRSSRRRSGSRGSSGSGAPLEHRLPSTSTAAAASTSAGVSNENDEWAQQQLTELQNMQTALRAQQPATPRSRAAGSTGGAELNTPELHRTRSSVSASPSAAAALSSPPLRPTQGAVSAPPSPALQMTTPIRHSAHLDRSPVGTDSSRRARSSHQNQDHQHQQQQDHPPGSTYISSGGNNIKDGVQRAERPAQVHGTSWSAASATKTPPSSRQQHEEAWLTPTAHRPTPVLSGRTTPPAKPASRLGSKPLTVENAAVGSARVPLDGHASSSFNPATTVTTSAPTTSATVAALGAALRTPLRQTLPPTTVDDSSERRRRANQSYHTHVPLASTATSSAVGSARRHDGAATATPLSTVSRSRPTTRADGMTATAASVGSVSRPTKAMMAITAAAARTTPSRNMGVEVSPRHTHVVGGPIGSARGRSSGAAPTSDGNVAPRWRGAAAADAPSSSLSFSSASPSTGFVPASTPAAGRGANQPRGGTSSTSAKELLRRLRASSAATV